MSDFIVAKNVSKIYLQGKRKVPALKNADITIGRQESVAIVGPSGAGKSTLLHILGGLDKPTHGKAFFEGKDIYRLNDKKRSFMRNRKIGFVFQFYNLLPDFNVMENAIMPALINRNRARNKADMIKKAEMILGRLDLSHRLKHKPNQLSGGEAQRVAIARALINDPEVVFFDEPTGNLDSAMSEVIYNIINEMHREKKVSVVVVTHSREHVEDFDSTYEIIDGELSERKKTWV